MAFLNKKRPESLAATPAIFLDKRCSSLVAPLRLNYSRIAGLSKTNYKDIIIKT